jgi:hypothetical protein
MNIDKIVMDPVISKEMRDSREPFATWAFKSLATGSVDVVESVLGLGEWKKCTECRNDTIKETIRKQWTTSKSWPLDVICEIRLG